MTFYQTTAIRISTKSKLADFLAKILKERAAKRERAKNIAELKSLGASALRDLGIDASEVSSVIDTANAGRRRGYEPTSN